MIENRQFFIPKPCLTFEAYIELMTYVEEEVTPEVKELKKPHRRMSTLEARALGMGHAIGDTYSGSCQTDDGLLGFSYKDFKENWVKTCPSF